MLFGQGQEAPRSYRVNALSRKIRPISIFAFDDKKVGIVGIFRKIGNIRIWRTT